MWVIVGNDNIQMRTNSAAIRMPFANSVKTYVDFIQKLSGLFSCLVKSFLYQTAAAAALLSIALQM